VAIEYGRRVGAGARRSTPRKTIDKSEINTGLANSQAESMGVMVRPGSPEDFGMVIAKDTEKVGQGRPSNQHEGG
jgi:hypothetical protein